MAAIIISSNSTIDPKEKPVSSLLCRCGRVFGSSSDCRCRCGCCCCCISKENASSIKTHSSGRILFSSSKHRSVCATQSSRFFELWLIVWAFLVFSFAVVVVLVCLAARLLINLSRDVNDTIRSIGGCCCCCGCCSSRSGSDSKKNINVSLTTSFVVLAVAVFDRHSKIPKALDVLLLMDVLSCGSKSC